MTRRFVFSISISVLLASLWLTAQVKDFRPVTEPMLRNPAPGDWLNWRRTDNAWGYSPLDQINTRNVQQLQLAWSWAMDNTGAQEATPLVHDGVMYLPNPRGVIQALDAATGDLIWECRPEVTTAATHGATFRWLCAQAATRGSRAATIRKRTSSIGARRRPNRGPERSAEPTATRSIPIRPWRSIRTRGK